MAPTAGPTTALTAVCLGALGGWQLWSNNQDLPSAPLDAVAEASAALGKTLLESLPGSALNTSAIEPAVVSPEAKDVVVDAASIPFFLAVSAWPWDKQTTIVIAVLVDAALFVAVCLCLRWRRGVAQQSVPQDSKAEKEPTMQGASRGLESPPVVAQHGSDTMLDGASQGDENVDAPELPAAVGPCMRGYLAEVDKATGEDAVKRVPSPVRKGQPAVEGASKEEGDAAEVAQ